MKARKTKSVVICVLLTLLLLVVLYNITASSSALMKRHIAKKYGIKAQEIDVTHFEWNRFDMDLGLDSSGTVNYRCRKWECKYKERDFIVEYGWFSYMDDYQLEDIFKWCTEYLQENYDKDIVGVEVYSDIIFHSPTYHFNYSLPWDNNKVFTKNDAKELFDTQRQIDYLTVFYKTENIYNYTKNNDLLLTNEKYNKFKSRKLNELNISEGNIVMVNKDDFTHTKTAINPYNFRQYAYSISSDSICICG